MSNVSTPLTSHRRTRLAAALLMAAVVLAGCGKKTDSAPAADGTTPSAAGAPVKPPAQAVSPQVAALDADALRGKARQAYQDSRLYAPAGDNAMEYYLALREKEPADPGASSALTDLLPMTVIATEQSRDRDDFVEAQRLYGLIEKADPAHPALPRLKTTIAQAETGLAKRAEQEKLTAAQEVERREKLEKDRLAQQAQQQQQAAQQLATQEATDGKRAAEEAAAAKRAVDEAAAAKRTAAAQPATPTPRSESASAEPAAPTLRAVSTPAPNYPPEALRSGTSGEVQVEFTVSADGSVSAARVVRANPARVFDREAVAAVRRWRFEPTGTTITTRRTIGFNPGN